MISTNPPKKFYTCLGCEKPFPLAHTGRTRLRCDKCGNKHKNKIKEETKLLNASKTNLRLCLIMDSFYKDEDRQSFLEDLYNLARDSMFEQEIRKALTNPRLAIESKSSYYSSPFNNKKNINGQTGNKVNIAKVFKEFCRQHKGGVTPNEVFKAGVANCPTPPANRLSITDLESRYSCLGNIPVYTPTFTNTVMNTSLGKSAEIAAMFDDAAATSPATLQATSMATANPAIASSVATPVTAPTTLAAPALPAPAPAFNLNKFKNSLSSDDYTKIFLKKYTFYNVDAGLPTNPMTLEELTTKLAKTLKDDSITLEQTMAIVLKNREYASWRLAQ